MKKMIHPLFTGLAFILMACSLPQGSETEQEPPRNEAIQVRVYKSDEQWKQELSDEEYRILREAGTEGAFTGQYWDFKGNGMYTCAGCGNVLFSSETKFKSGTGWPSFYAVAADTSITEDLDTLYGMTRTEVLCAKCDGHLGHVFDDGPPPTGLRYCINSAALDFKAR